MLETTLHYMFPKDIATINRRLQKVYNSITDHYSRRGLNGFVLEAYLLGSKVSISTSQFKKDGVNSLFEENRWLSDPPENSEKVLLNLKNVTVEINLEYRIPTRKFYGQTTENGTIMAKYEGLSAKQLEIKIQELV